MNEEEKKAYNFLKFYSNDYAKTIIKLIDKQQKEIEGWKKLHNNLSNTYDNLSNTYDNMLDIVENDFIEKDKIREKIKELEKEKTEVIHELDFKGFYTLSQLKDIEISVLKELLEE